MRVMRGLEARGLIWRVYAPSNRRNLSISLSKAGLDLLIKTQEPAELAYNRLMAPLNLEQREQLVSLLQLLTKGLEGDARAAFVPPIQDKDDIKVRPLPVTESSVTPLVQKRALNSL
jgi:MarR family transcriptional regulator, lower aerobic nicotinate degradation pathway regulator